MIDEKVSAPVPDAGVSEDPTLQEAQALQAKVFRDIIGA